MATREELRGWDPLALRDDLVVGNYEDALIRNEACLVRKKVDLRAAQNRASFSQAPPPLPAIPSGPAPGLPLGPGGMLGTLPLPDIGRLVDSIGSAMPNFDRLAVLGEQASVCRLMAGSAQILAFMGQTADAEAMLSRYRSHLESNRLLGPAVKFGDSLLWTEGLIAERAKQPDRAIQCYQSAQLKDLGRAAVVALSQKDDDRARNWASVATVAKDPTGHAVLGAIAELEGDEERARIEYEAAYRLMMDLTVQGTPRSALPFAEGPRVLAGLRRVRNEEWFDGLRPVREGNRTVFYDASGTAVGWERWPLVQGDDEVLKRQHEYNEWAAGLSSPPRPIRFMPVPQFPRFFSGFFGAHPLQMALDEPGWTHFHIPQRLEPTGVLDRDVLAIPLYQSAVELAEIASKAGISLEAGCPDDGNWTTKAGSDAVLREMLRGEIADALKKMLEFHAAIQNIPMSTPSGRDVTAHDEAASFAQDLGWIESNFAEARKGIEADLQAEPYEYGRVALTGHMRYVLPSFAFEDPPEFAKLSIRGEILGPERLASLEQYERETKAHVMGASLVADAYQDSLSG